VFTITDNIKQIPEGTVSQDAVFPVPKGIRRWAANREYNLFTSVDKCKNTVYKCNQSFIDWE